MTGRRQIKPHVIGLDSLIRDPRVRVRRAGAPPARARCVVYWMQRAQRGVDNPALSVAIRVANAMRLPLAVHFGLHPRYPGANQRHYAFLLDGLPETARRCEARGAAFVFRPHPHHSIVEFCGEVHAGVLIGDENPLREPERWRVRAAESLRIPFWTVDADVIVPTCHFEREEYAARTIRPKIRRLLPKYLVRPGNPRVKARWAASDRPPTVPIDPAAFLRSQLLDRRAAIVPGARGGTAAGLRTLRRFLRDRLATYSEDRNDPTLDGTSGLSAYLHFGHLGPHTVALAVRSARAPRAAKEAFLEELIVRRELAIQFVARNPNHDCLECAPAWALKTLREHRRDTRPHLYSEAELERGQTRDPLWNAAQLEMVTTGRMHGYMRMYWAKKILEWTESPEEAFRIAVLLNDRYELDGRDPNGYAGIAWAIAGKHDRPWAPKRPVFGMVRYMSASGAARKFDVEGYIARVERVRSVCAKSSAL